MCPDEYCVGGDNYGYITGVCMTGYGCTADDQSNPTTGKCKALPSCNTVTDGCYNADSCSNMCTSQCCGSSCSMWQYNTTDGTVAQVSALTGTCGTDYHCAKDFTASSGTCKTGEIDTKKAAGGAVIGLILVILLILCCVCGYCHHKKKKEQEAVHEAMLANEQAQSSAALAD